MTSIFSSLFGSDFPNRSASLGVDDFARYLEEYQVVLLDVRTAEEFASAHLPGAINVDVQQNSFVDTALRYLEPGRRVALYCRSGARSKIAMRLLDQEGFRVMELDSGILGWIEAGRDVE